MKILRKLNDKFQENLSRPGIIDARARYLVAARRLINTDLLNNFITVVYFNIALSRTIMQVFFEICDNDT